MPQQHAVLSGFVYDDLGNRTVYRSPRVLERWGQSDPETLAMLSDAASERRPVGFEIAFGADPGDVPAHFWQARGFHLASWTHSVQRTFAEALRRHEIPFTLDPGRQVAPHLLKETLKIAPAFLPSESDVTHLLGEVELDEALERLAGMGPSVVAVKLGAAGSTVCDCRTGERHHVPAFPTRAKDPTGAGDAYCGGFLVGWIETGDVREAALRGTVSASFVVEDFDARHALQFSRQDAEARLHKLRSMVT
jgi:ribokinase